MKENHIPKTFIRALQTFHHNIRATEKFFKDKRLSHEEKTILKGWCLLRKNKVHEVLESIESLSANNNIIIESQRKLLLGVIYNNLGNNTKALDYLKAVPETVEGFSDVSLNYIALYNLFICHFNLNNIKEAEQILFKFSKLHPQSTCQEVLHKQCEFMFYILKSDIGEANLRLSYIEKHQNCMTESMKLGHIHDKINFYLMQEKLDDCYHSLDELKKCRNFQISENYIYMKILLEHLLHGKALYLYSYQFKLNHVLYYHLKVIHSLESMNIKSAELYWSKLMSIDKNVYQSDFVLKGEVSLFSIALKRYQKHLKSSKPSSALAVGTEFSKDKILYELLMNSEVPLSKEVIHQLIWGKDLVDKSDMTKLKKLISRIRTIYNIEIQYRNGCYSLLKTSSSVA